MSDAIPFTLVDPDRTLLSAREHTDSWDSSNDFPASQLQKKSLLAVT